jgi:NAD(P)-dependent dehydrogenase (short-subunit alcohol dehydrogenase family)
MTSTYLVIGASTGLGRETARALARDHRVIVAGRNAEADVNVDLRDLADVARAASELRAKGPFAGVVCNAGVQQTGEPTFTTDKLEETFAVNHLAHFAMVLKLSLAPGTRVALIGSGTLDPDNAGARRFGFRGGRYTTARALAAGKGDPDVGAAQNARDRYATSKLCNLLTVQALAQRGIAAVAFDPGLMPGTGLARNYNLVMRAAWSSVMKLVGCFMSGASSAKRSGAALAWLMTTPDVVAGGYYDFHRRLVETPAVARRADHAEELYSTSLELAGFTEDPLVHGSHEEVG